ncbi:MAG: HupE/UreJ family protein [Myxococcota bacterium]|nr:HupE/UreJ family protein [Myxococcota bacterium]
MNETSSFFLIGWQHIVDINAYDHLLFVTTLCAAYQVMQWRQILIIVTAFTLGHSGTLVLSSLELIPTNQTLVEILVPITIMATAIVNILKPAEKPDNSDVKIKYGIALCFGLVHGLAFANNFKVIMFGESILWPLFLFNVGIEVGQIFIVILFMATLWIYSEFLDGDHYKWNIFMSGAGFGIAGTLVLNTLTKS